MQFSSKYIYRNVKNVKLIAILNHRTKKLLQQTVITCIALAIALTAFAIYPLFLYIFWNDTKPLLLPIVLPFFHPQSNLGYYINVLLQIGICFFGVFGNYGYEIINSLILNNLWAATDVVQFSLNEFTLNLKGYQFVANRRASDFRNVFCQLQDIDE